MTEPPRPPALRDLDLGVGKRTRLHQFLYGAGPANGTALLLRVDQGLEQGPIAFFDNPVSADPAGALALAHEGGFSGAILQVGLAEKYLRDLAGRVPLLLKLNGKTAIPPEDEALAPLNATVEDAVRLGAAAVAYSLYVGSPAQFEDFTQLSQVRQDCQRYGMPLLVLATPRGAAIERKGGAESFYAVEYAARMADELGADLVQVAAPASNPQRDAQAPRPYNTLQISPQEALRRVVAAAGKTPVLVGHDGGGDAETVLAHARLALQSGAIGLVYGHALWLRPQAEARALAEHIRQALAEVGP